MIKIQNWIPLTEADIQTYLAGPQLELIRHWGQDTHSADPLAKVIHDTATFIRGFLPSSISIPADIPPTFIPDTLLLDAAALVIEALHVRIPTLPLSEHQARLAKRAHDHLQSLNKEDAHCSSSRKNKNDSSRSYHRIQGKSRTRRVTNDNLQDY